jgi:hypothetical protein
MSRLARKNWTVDKFGILDEGGILDAFDNAFKSGLRITDDEMDYISATSTDDELELVTREKLTFSQKRQLINYLNIKVYGRV